MQVTTTGAASQTSNSSSLPPSTTGLLRKRKPPNPSLPLPLRTLTPLGPLGVSFTFSPRDVFVHATVALSPAGKPEVSSEMSEEELEKARQFRKNTFKKTGGTLYLLCNLHSFSLPSLEIDLTAIARTSVVVGSPPQGSSRPGQENKRVSAASSVSSQTKSIIFLYSDPVLLFLPSIDPFPCLTYYIANSLLATSASTFVILHCHQHTLSQLYL